MYSQFMMHGQKNIKLRSLLLFIRTRSCYSHLTIVVDKLKQHCRTYLTALITVTLRRYQPSNTSVFKWKLYTSNRNWKSLHEFICICTQYRL